MKILAENAIAIGIDYQERLIPAINENTAVIRNACILFSGLALLHVPVIVSRQYPKGLGDTVAEIREVTGSATVLDKTSFSCCGDAGIRQALERSGRKTVILGGVEAHVCVLQTAVDLRAAGYQVVYVIDCTGSRKAEDKKYALKRAEQEGALLVTCEQIVFELLGDAAAPAFKDISKLVR
jgi:nicotinamidase-related amidase